MLKQVCLTEVLSLVVLQLVCAWSIDRARLTQLAPILVGDVVAIHAHTVHMLPHTAMHKHHMYFNKSLMYLHTYRLV
jgi:hypothetical protein